MLTTRSLQQLLRPRPSQTPAQQPDPERLLRALADNGLPMPLPLRARLANHPAAALALALRRALELAYGPSPLIQDLLHALHAADPLQDPEFTSDPAALACLIAGLNRAIAELPAQFTTELHPLRHQAWQQLTQTDQGLLAAPADRTDDDRALTSAFALYLLADDPQRHQHLRLGDLLSALDALQLDHPLPAATQTLYAMAQHTTPHPPPTAPLFAA